MKELEGEDVLCKNYPRLLCKYVDTPSDPRTVENVAGMRANSKETSKKRLKNTSHQRVSKSIAA